MQTTIPVEAEDISNHRPALEVTVTPLMVTALAAGIPVEDVAAYARAPRSLDLRPWQEVALIDGFLARGLTR